MRCFFLFLLVAVLGRAESPRALLGTNELMHLDAALGQLNMGRSDLGFKKDYVAARLVSERARKCLSEPLSLATYGDAVMAAVEEDRIPALLLDALELTNGPDVVSTSDEWSGDLPQELRTPIESFVGEAFVISRQVETAFDGLSDPERRYLAGRACRNIWDPDLYAGIDGVLKNAGVDDATLKVLDDQEDALDPEPAVTRWLDGVEAIHMAKLSHAGAALYRAAVKLSNELQKIDRWPQKVVRVESPFGEILVGTEQPDRHEEPAFLVLDPGGDDRYGDGPGAANGLKARPLAVVIDLGGDDQYTSKGLVGAGAALQGCSVVLDLAGRDIYRAEWAGQAAALQGVAVLEDGEGHDRYRGSAFSQAAAIVGMAWLHDRDGSDRYDVGYYGQGFSGVRGAAVLADRAGADVYHAGGGIADRGRHDDHALTLAQGFSIGSRPFAGGGMAALVDLAGNDTYKADIYGQGVSYFYAIGMLLDAGGNDTYVMHHYGQGSGIHLSSGLLGDYGGNDTYSGYILAQGNAHDFSVGMLVDHQGDDTYTADHHAQGRALNNGLGVLMDSAGNDAYFGRQPDQCQGVGNNGGTREYGSLGILCDLGGKDRYTCGAEDGARLLRPLYGIVYDLEESGK